MTPQEKADFIDKAHLDISYFDWGHFKFSGYLDSFNQRLTEFKNREEEPVRAAADKLLKHVEGLDKSIEEHKYFKNEEAYRNIEADLLAAFIDGD